MLHLWRNPRDGYFFLRNGQRRRALGTKDPETARKLFKAAEKEALDGRLATMEGRSRATLSQFLNRYIAGRGDRKADTIRADKNAFRKLIEYFGENTFVATVRREEVRQWMSSLKDAGEKQNSIHNYCRHLRAAWNEAMEWTPPLARKNPFAKLKLKRVRTRIPILVVGEVQGALLSACDVIAEEEKAGSPKKNWQRWLDFKRMIQVYLAGGLRRFELVGLKWEDVREGTVIVRGKGDRLREIPITSTTRALLGERGKPREYVFPRWRGRDTITRMFKQVARKAGYPDTTPHHLRHTTESQLAAMGVDLKGRMEMLGHSTQEMALHYTHVTREQLLDALNRIDGEREKKVQGAVTQS